MIGRRAGPGHPEVTMLDPGPGLGLASQVTGLRLVAGAAVRAIGESESTVLKISI